MSGGISAKDHFSLLHIEGIPRQVCLLHSFISFLLYLYEPFDGSSHALAFGFELYRLLHINHQKPHNAISISYLLCDSARL